VCVLCCVLVELCVWRCLHPFLLVYANCDCPEEREKVKQAKQKLQQMQQRVRQRPFLFQLAQKEAALKRAREKFRQTIIESGLDPAEFNADEGAAAGAH